MTRRSALLLIAAPLYAVALMALATLAVTVLFDPRSVPGTVVELVLDPLDAIGDLLGEELWWAWCGVPALVLVATQLVFVVPLVSPVLRIAPRGRSVILSLVVAAGVAAVLTVGMLLTLLELAGLLPGVVDARVLWPAGAVLVTSWLAWSIAFIAFTRDRRDPTRLERLVGLLLGGTVLEFLAIVPVDVMVRRRTDCYCDTGTFYALLISTWAAMWLAGPGALVLYLRRRRRRAVTSCVHCGYRKGPSPPDRCPECGSEWGGEASDTTARAPDG